MQFRAGHRLKFIKRHGSEFLTQNKATFIDVDDCVARIDAGDATNAGQRERTLFHELRLALFGDMLGNDNHLLGTMNQIHRPTNRRHALGTNAPIGEIAILRHLISTQNRHIEMTAAHHGKTVSMMEKGRGVSKAITKHGSIPSMGGGKGNYYDNAMVEIVFKTTKSEMVWRTLL